MSRHAPLHRLAGLSFREYLEMQLGLQFPINTVPQILQEHETVARDIVTRLETSEREGPVAVPRVPAVGLLNDNFSANPIGKA